MLKTKNMTTLSYSEYVEIEEMIKTYLIKNLTVEVNSENSSYLGSGIQIEVDLKIDDEIIHSSSCVIDCE